MANTTPGHSDYLSTTIDYITENDDKEKKLVLNYPFNRFYMEESKAKPAEDAHWEASRDTSQITYALVNIKNGKAVLKNVLINGKPIKEVVEELR